MQMNLYQRWQDIADQFSGEQALLDWKTGRSWTFLQLQQEVDRRPCADTGKVIFSNGWAVELIFETLCGWRDGRLLCPVEGEAPDPDLFDGIADNIVHVKMTSGSTAQPKLILFKAEQLLADANNVVATMQLKREWPNLGVISMAHSYGFSNLVTPLLLHGIPLLWLGDPLPAMLSDVFEKTESRFTLPAVPAMWRVWMQAGVLNQSNVEIAISAGAPLSLDLEQGIYDEAGLKVHNFYGSSECGGIAYDRSDQPRLDRSCVGTPMDNVELQIRDEDGCLSVSSQAVGEGYWPESVEASLCEGQFVSADCVEINAASAELLLRERSSDTINVAGRKVAPGKIEAAILSVNPSLEHCLVFGVPSQDAERVEEVIACVSISEAEWDASRSKSAVQAQLENYEMPRHWWFCPGLKPNSRGKFSRSEWSQRYRSL